MVEYSCADGPAAPAKSERVDAVERLVSRYNGQFVVETEGDLRRVNVLSVSYTHLLVPACDLIARMAFAPFELPVGILMSAIGGPFFLVLLLRRRGGHGNA